LSTSMEQKIKGKVVVVSGGFDPLHIGHVQLFKAAKELGDTLVIIMNNDNWLKYKRGYVFMPENERKEIIKELQCVDRVILTEHSFDTDDISICETLTELKPDIFANGGDRKADNIPEYKLCKELGIEMVFNLGNKIQSSSELLKRYVLNSS